jgi:hypothetical protein
MQSMSEKWWKHPPEKPWPLWMKLLDAVLIAILAWFWTVFPGVVGFVVGLTMLLLGASVFFVWQWVGWKRLRAIR